MPATINYTGRLTVTSCWCGIHVAIPDDLYRQAREQGRTVYCPLGHQFVWTTTELDRQRERADQAEADRKYYSHRFQAERDLRQHTEKRLSAQKAATTRAKRRHAAGVCPCCNRTFQQLRRHMASQHPDYDPSRP